MSLTPATNIFFSDNSGVFAERQERGGPCWLLKLKWMGTHRVQMKGNLPWLVFWACLASPVQNIFFHHRWKADSSAAFPCGVMNFIPALGIHFQIANSSTRRRGIFKGLSQDGGRADFSTNLRASLCNKDLSNGPNFGRIHVAVQYFLLDRDCSKIKFYFIILRAHLWKHPHRGYCEHNMGRFWAQSNLCVKLAFGQVSKKMLFSFFFVQTR